MVAVGFGWTWEHQLRYSFTFQTRKGIASLEYILCGLFADGASYKMCKCGQIDGPKQILKGFCFSLVRQTASWLITVP